jgi:hypothetical protein
MKTIVSPIKDGGTCFARFALRLLIPSAALALAALPMGCRSVPEPASPPTAEKGQPKQTDTAPVKPVAMELHTPGGDEVLDNIRFASVPLPDVIQTLGKQAGLHVQIDPSLLNQQAADGSRIPPPAVNERWRKVTSLQALEALLDNYGWRMEWKQNDPTVRILAATSHTVDPRTTKFDLLEKAPTDNHEADEATCIVFNNVPLPEAIKALALQVGLNIQMDPLLANPRDAAHHPIPSPIVNEEWQNATARQTLQKLLDKHGLQMTRIPGNPIIRIGANLEANDLR